MTQVIAHKDKDDEIKQYHKKRFEELSLKSLGEIPHLQDPNDEQLEWVNRRMKASVRSWEAYRQ